MTTIPSAFWDKRYSQEGFAYATGMPIVETVGTSLAAVVAFGFTTAASCASADMVDWRIASEFVLGGIIGGGLMLAARRLAGNGGALNKVYAVLEFSVGIYVFVRNLGAFA